MEHEILTLQDVIVKKLSGNVGYTFYCKYCNIYFNVISMDNYLECVNGCGKWAVRINTKAYQIFRQTGVIPLIGMKENNVL